MTAITVADEPLERVRAISFGAADTLFHNTSVWDSIAPDLNQHNVDRSTWVSAVDAVGAAGLWPEDSATPDERRIRWRDFYTTCLARTTVGPQVDIADAAARATTDPRCFALFPDTEAALRRLTAAGVPLVITSNFDLLLHDILDELDLRRWFVGVVCSFETGCYKPDPRIFEQSALLLGLPTTSLLHVGDSPMSDATGSRNAGLTPLLVDRPRRVVAPVLTISTLDHLGVA